MDESVTEDLPSNDAMPPRKCPSPHRSRHLLAISFLPETSKNHKKKQLKTSKSKNSVLHRVVVIYNCLVSCFSYMFRAFFCACIVVSLIHPLCGPGLRRCLPATFAILLPYRLHCLCLQNIIILLVFGLVEAIEIVSVLSEFGPASNFSHRSSLPHQDRVVVFQRKTTLARSSTYLS